jgi:hypothetical protein
MKVLLMLKRLWVIVRSGTRRPTVHQLGPEGSKTLVMVNPLPGQVG